MTWWEYDGDNKPLLGEKLSFSKLERFDFAHSLKGELLTQCSPGGLEVGVDVIIFCEIDDFPGGNKINWDI